MVRIAGVGVCCLDHIVVAPMIAWGDSTGIRDYCVQGGGLVATAIVACARLGAQTELYSLVGSDPTGEAILDELRREGVSVDGVARIDGAESPFSFIHVDAETGERTIFYRGGRGLKWPGGDISGVASADALLVDGSYAEMVLAAASAAREAGVPVVADVSPSASNRELLSNVDVLIAPRHFVRQGGFGEDSDAALKAILDAGPGVAVITLGADGWIASEGGQRFRGAAFTVDVVDTVGAGDVFHGAYAFGLANGWSVPQCAEFAAAVAAIGCTKLGGRTGIPDLAHIAAFLKEHGTAEWSDLLARV